jgi:hypothetical protein
MATSDVEVCNLALAKLGSGRIASLTEDSTNANAVNDCYDHLRKTELRRNKWNFARRRASLAASAVEPDFDYDAAYPLPTECLRLLPPAVNGLDWQIESHEGQNAILSNDSAPLEIVYIADITDPTKFDMSFSEMLACRIADHICIKVMGNASLKQIVMQEYKDARAEAKRNNAFENVSEEPPEDQWLAARR